MSQLIDKILKNNPIFVPKPKEKPVLTFKLKLKSTLAGNEQRCHKCDTNTGQDWHICPFAAEIHDDYDTMCNCCDQCSHDCADDI